MCKECEIDHKHYTCECGKDKESRRLPNGLFKCENPGCPNEHDGSYGSGRFCSDHCRRVFSGKQVKVHICNFNKHKKSMPYGTWTCKFCKKIFESKHKLYHHYHECHNDKLFGPHGKGQCAWNKGLTCSSDERVRQISDTLKERYRNGELVASFIGKHHSHETKEKLRILALNSKHQRVCKKTFIYKKLNGDEVKMDSSYELIVAKILDSHNIDWIRPKPIPWTDDNGIVHNYFADFFIPSKNIYLDPKNEYCFRV